MTSSALFMSVALSQVILAPMSQRSGESTRFLVKGGRVGDRAGASWRVPCHGTHRRKR